MSKEKLRSFYEPRDPVDFHPVGESMTRQEFLEECDINTIMKRYDQFGVISHQSRRVPMYGDFSDIPDYREAMELINAAAASFAALPANIRARFGNDPAAFVDYCQDPENLPELRRLGLANVPEPSKTAVGPDAAPDGAKSGGPPDGRGKEKPLT